MNIVQKHIDEIRPYWRNPRKNEKAVEAVKESIKQYGYNSPIVVDEKNVIIAGHTRYKALRQLGYEDIPVIVLEISEDKAKQYRIADNKSAEKAEWDKDLLMFELRSIEELDDMTLFFDAGELDKFFDSGGANEIKTFTAADYASTEAIVRTSVVQDIDDEPSETDRAEYDRRVQEEVDKRMAEEAKQRAILEAERERERQARMAEENEKIRAEELKMQDRFSDRSTERNDDLIKVKCPHCDEVYMLSKGELLRKAEIGHD